MRYSCYTKKYRQRASWRLNRTVEAAIRYCFLCSMSFSVMTFSSITGVENAVFSIVHPVVKKIIIKRNSSTMINVTIRSFLRLIRPSVPSYINILLLIWTLCVYYTSHHESVKNKVYYFIFFYIFY